MGFRDIRTQFGLIAIFVHNLIYNLIPFFILKNAYLRFTKTQIGQCSYIHPWVRFTWIGKLSIGKNSTVNFGCLLDTRRYIYIGNNVMVGHNTKIYSTGHDYNDPYFKQSGAPVAIEDNVVIFPNVLIMPNITIRRGAVVLPGSVVTKDIGEFEVVGGNPAKFIKKRSEVLNYKLDYGFWFGNA